MSDSQAVEPPVVDNPFALMLDPESVWRALERSERLARLQRRVCRPLDKPLADGAADSSSEADGG